MNIVGSFPIADSSSWTLDATGRICPSTGCRIPVTANWLAFMLFICIPNFTPQFRLQAPYNLRRQSTFTLLRRWADRFCLHCNIFIYIRHIRIKPVLCSRMVSFFHHTSPWTHRRLDSSPSAHRNGRVFRRSVQTACCYWILNRGKRSSNWNSQTNASPLWWSVCWCECSKTPGKVKSAVRKWFTKQNTNFFKDGFQKLVQRWRKCIEVRGDFVEK